MNSYLSSVSTRSLKSLSIGKTRVDRMVIHPFSEASTRISCASHMLINRHLGQWALPSFRAQGGASLTELGVISVQHTKTSRNPPIYIQIIFLLGMRDFPLQKKIAGGYRKCWISMNVWFSLKAHQIQGSSMFFYFAPTVLDACCILQE